MDIKSREEERKILLWFFSPPNWEPISPSLRYLVEEKDYKLYANPVAANSIVRFGMGCNDFPIESSFEKQIVGFDAVYVDLLESATGKYRESVKDPGRAKIFRSAVGYLYRNFKFVFVTQDQFRAFADWHENFEPRLPTHKELNDYRKTYDFEIGECLRRANNISDVKVNIKSSGAVSLRAKLRA